MYMITDDIFFGVLQYSNFETIVELCKINKKFYKKCENQPKFMERIKRNGLVISLNENELLLRKFSFDCNYIFDKECRTRLKTQDRIFLRTVYDKEWVQLMFLLHP